MVLSPRMPDLASLETLKAVVGTGSLNAAATQLGVTQQAVSARIRAMETQLGVALLTRTLRAVRCRRSPGGSSPNGPTAC